MIAKVCIALSVYMNLQYKIYSCEYVCMYLWVYLCYLCIYGCTYKHQKTIIKQCIWQLILQANVQDMFSVIRVLFLCILFNLCHDYVTKYLYVMYLCIFPFTMYGIICIICEDSFRNLWEAIDLLCKRIMRSSAGNIQIATGCLIGAIGSAIGIHLIQSRIGQSTWYGIAGHAMWSQMRGFFSHLWNG